MAFVIAIFVLIPFPLGFVLLRKIIRIELKISKRDRIVLVIIGVLGLFFWSGLFLGPLLTILAAVYPYNKVY